MNKQLPDGWKLIKIRDLCKKVFVGIATSTTNSYVESGGVPLLRNQNIKEGVIDNSEILQISQSFANRNKNKELEIGDVITARTGYPGSSAVINSNYAGSHSFTTLISRLNQDIIIPHYYSIYLNSSLGKKQIYKNQAGGAQENLNVSSLEKITIKLPSLPEQKKIAEILSTLDLLLNHLLEKINKTKILRKSNIQFLLSKGINQNNYKESILGQIASSWDVKRLTDVLEVKHGFQFRDHHFAKKGIPIVKIGNLIDGKTVDISSANSFISSEEISEFKKFKLNKKDILMALTGATLGKVSIYESNLIALQNYRVGKFQSKDTNIVNNQFIYWILQSEYIQNIVQNLVNEAAQPNIGKADLEKMYIPIPPLKEQIKINHILASIDKSIKSTEVKFDQLKLLKKSLYNDLLIGRKRVNI